MGHLGEEAQEGMEGGSLVPKHGVAWPAGLYRLLIFPILLMVLAISPGCVQRLPETGETIRVQSGETIRLSPRLECVVPTGWSGTWDPEWAEADDPLEPTGVLELESSTEGGRLRIDVFASEKKAERFMPLKPESGPVVRVDYGGSPVIGRVRRQAQRPSDVPLLAVSARLTGDGGVVNLSSGLEEYPPGTSASTGDAELVRVVLNILDITRGGGGK